MRFLYVAVRKIIVAMQRAIIVDGLELFSHARTIRFPISATELPYVALCFWFYFFVAGNSYSWDKSLAPSESEGATVSDN